MSLPTGIGEFSPPPNQPQGVVITPPGAVHIDIHEQVMKSLRKDVEPGHFVAMVGIQTDRGINFAVARKDHVTEGIFKGDWVVESWIGKSGWNKPLSTDGFQGGVQVMWSR